MYVCDKCIEAHGLAIDRNAPTTVSPCEVCSELSDDWRNSDFLTWTNSLRRFEPVEAQLAKLKTLVHS
jgi:hypothetical protein